MRIAFAHVDVDIHRSIIDSCAFIYPRLLQGGRWCSTTTAWRLARARAPPSTSFFADKPEVPLVLRTGQAVIFRSLPPGYATSGSNL